jgi:hypothetical protein
MRFSCGHEIADEEILQAAGAIRSRLRKSHHGGRPRGKYTCRWCSATCMGMKVLGEHELFCRAKPDYWPEIPDIRSLLAD